MRSVPSDIRRLGAFFAVAFTISWAWLIPLALSGRSVHQGSGWPTHFPALLGPMLAAVLVTGAVRGHDGLLDLGRRMVRWRVPWRWWLAALSPIGFLLLAVGIGLVMGRPLPAIADFGRMTGLPAGTGVGVLGVLAALVIVNGLGEETGWRGFAVPQLQRRHRPLAASLLLVPFWAAWHLPMFWVLDTFRGFNLVLSIGWLIGLACGSVVLSWVYNGSRGSILLVAVWHGLYNVASGTLAAQGWIAAVVSTLVMLQAAVLVVTEVRSGRRPTMSRALDRVAS